MIHIDLMYLSMISILAPTFLGVALFKKFHRELKALVILVLATCILEGIVYVAWQYNVNNLAIFHLFTYIEFGCISFMYFGHLRRIRLMRYGILALSATFLILSVYFLLEKETFDQYNSMQRALEHMIVLTYVLVFLYLFSKRLPEERYLLKPYFYLSIGWLIYFSGTFMVFLEAHKYVEFDGFFNWSIHSVLNIFLNAIYFAVFWMAGRMMRSKS